MQLLCPRELFLRRIRACVEKKDLAEPERLREAARCALAFAITKHSKDTPARQLSNKESLRRLFKFFCEGEMYEPTLTADRVRTWSDKHGYDNQEVLQFLYIADIPVKIYTGKDGNVMLTAAPWVRSRDFCHVTFGCTFCDSMLLHADCGNRRDGLHGFCF